MRGSKQRQSRLLILPAVSSMRKEGLQDVRWIRYGSKWEDGRVGRVDLKEVKVKSRSLTSELDLNRVPAPSSHVARCA